jgi:hypothetical protein
LRGWSTSWPSTVATSQANTCSGHRRHQRLHQRRHLGQPDDLIGVGGDGRVALLGQDDRAGAASTHLLDVAHHLAVQGVAPTRRDDHEDRQTLLNERDRARA